MGELYNNKYKTEYCQMLIKHMEEGLSFASFAGTIDTTEKTLHNWKNKYPEFKRAYEKGMVKSMLVWEKMGRAGAVGKIKGFNTACWIFNLKNRFGWRDKLEIQEQKQEDYEIPKSLKKGK